ncbi:MAG: recombinase family protein [Desulfovibrionaceae bacterium]
MYQKMKKVNCAIYVRKSTEKGLELEFNSLHNQEEACRNYILSQAFNNWEYHKTYTDGGISGGSMERPALQEMLQDIKVGKIQVVVVYKVDRLSRSIMDFHNMMKELEEYNCSFVSITQAFDTSTSMGKLTLNMLLSFAQFEREVSSERVRDKIRAQKAKGLWTGGNIPLGYDVIEKKLVINKEEAKQVQYIFETYLDSSSLLDLQERVYNEGIRVKQRKRNKSLGKEAGMLSTTVLNRILREPLYIGKVSNKKEGLVYNGVHEGIISKKLFYAVQEKLSANNNRGDVPCNYGTFLLDKKIQDTQGNIFKNQRASKKQKKYRYYALQGCYLPAGDIEKITCDVIQEFLDSNMKALPEATRLAFKQVEYSLNIIRSMIEKVIYYENKLLYFINIEKADYLEPFRCEQLNIKSKEMLNSYISTDNKYLVIEKFIYISKGIATNRYNGGETSILTKTENANRFIKALAYAWRYKKLYESGMSIHDIRKQEHIAHRTVYKYLNLAYLSPRIINYIMEGKEESNISLQELFQIASSYSSFEEQEGEIFCKMKLSSLF